MVVDRLKASGYVGNNAQRDAPFKFLVRPFATVGVDSLDLAAWFENEIFSAIKDLPLEWGITGIAIFPTIFDGTVASVPNDYVTYKKKEKSVFVGLNIDFLSWTNSSKEQKLGLLAENIKRSIERIPDKYLSALYRKRLLDIGDQVHKRLIARVLN